MEYRLDVARREESARRIQTCWRSHHNRKLIQYLITIIRSAEQYLTPAVLQQVSPVEAKLLRDPSVPSTVRFRFSGEQFPPVIVFKIFHTGRTGQYLSGKKLFRSSNQATVETCRLMGNRKFMDLMVEDEVWWRGRNIADPLDITCMRDYIQYSAHLDELPAGVGGRENRWRRLDLQVLSRDQRWKQEPSEPAGRPSRPARSPTAPPSTAVTSRRSARAQSAAARRKHLYTLQVRGVEPGEEQTGEGLGAGECPGRSLSKVLDEEEAWEEEAEQLCSWTNQITLDTIQQLEDL
ncbi:uncharacterized protein CXorf58 homolog isoform X2 [Astyanax mexicanus]|uniref:Chromosome X open reading frame 58 n=1 Tax=Astyanax mexicanus TaxID=7994 RepID=A0A3B1JR06_ASTMX|nr:uncharacterized protein CXorf58 homolog isoform X2 [Astyanax mexicanus]